jgi:hypothetical protein
MRNVFQAFRIPRSLRINTTHGALSVVDGFSLRRRKAALTAEDIDYVAVKSCRAKFVLFLGPTCVRLWHFPAAAVAHLISLWIGRSVIRSVIVNCTTCNTDSALRSLVAVQ